MQRDAAIDTILITYLKNLDHFLIPWQTHQRQTQTLGLVSCLHKGFYYVNIINSHGIYSEIYSEINANFARKVYCK